MVSTLPRAAATCKHMDHMVVECYAALNPLDKGVYEGLTLKEVEERDPAQPPALAWFSAPPA